MPVRALRLFASCGNWFRQDDLPSALQYVSRIRAYPTRFAKLGCGRVLGNLQMANACVSTNFSRIFNGYKNMCDHAVASELRLNEKGCNSARCSAADTNTQGEDISERIYILII